MALILTVLYLSRVRTTRHERVWLQYKSNVSMSWRLDHGSIEVHTNGLEWTAKSCSLTYKR